MPLLMHDAFMVQGVAEQTRHLQDKEACMLRTSQASQTGCRHRRFAELATIPRVPCLQAISQLKGSLTQLSTAHTQLLGELQVALPLQHASEQAVQQLQSAGLSPTSSAAAAPTQTPRNPAAKGSAA